MLQNFLLTLLNYSSKETMHSILGFGFMRIRMKEMFNSFFLFLDVKVVEMGDSAPHS